MCPAPVLHTHPLPHPASCLQGCVPGGTSNRAMAGRYLTSHDCARRLRESLREEHILVLDFVSTISKHVSDCVGPVHTHGVGGAVGKGRQQQLLRRREAWAAGSG